MRTALSVSLVLARKASAHACNTRAFGCLNIDGLGRGAGRGDRDRDQQAAAIAGAGGDGAAVYRGDGPDDGQAQPEAVLGRAVAEALERSEPGTLASSPGRRP
jgi:hypothetical protein